MKVIMRGGAVCDGQRDPGRPSGCVWLKTGRADRAQEMHAMPLAHDTVQHNDEPPSAHAPDPCQCRPHMVKQHVTSQQVNVTGLLYMYMSKPNTAKVKNTTIPASTTPEGPHPGRWSKQHLALDSQACTFGPMTHIVVEPTTQQHPCRVPCQHKPINTCSSGTVVNVTRPSSISPHSRQS